jgi:hypothetical protein
MMENMKPISLMLFVDLQFLLLHSSSLLQIPLLQPLLLLLLLHLLLLLREDLHLQLLLSHLVLLLIRTRSRTSSSRTSRLSSPCVAPMTLSSVRLINR